MYKYDDITEDVVEDMMTSWYMGEVGLAHENSFAHGTAIQLTVYPAPSSLSVCTHYRVQHTQDRRYVLM